jgi:hypothetical protein
MISKATVVVSRTGSTQKRAASVAPAKLFTSEEVIVIGLAKKEALNSLREARGIQGLIELVFGFKRPRPLANARLETLRHAAIRLRHNATTPDTLPALRTAGFSGEQIQDLMHMVQRMRFVATARSTMVPTKRDTC